ncbi:hypothetical protein CK203_034554 [Vitis vinifera]|uniref:DUF4283 domain-containing protein n=1 Tax=Vitis vinifera TaxID=29760 RepID=A0A438IDP1_VITVI|nr:hypothetical protein CK203_034554 [Vitis vinifera]
MLEKRSFADVVKKAHGVVGEVVWLQLGVMEFLPTLKRWAARSRNLKGGVRLSLIRDALIPFYFEEASNAESMFVLRKRGDSCGGFLVVDKDTAQQRKLQWAAVLVKSNRRRMPRTLTSGGLIVLCDTALVEVPPWPS